MKRILLYIFLLTNVGMATAQTSIPESGWMTINTVNNRPAGGTIVRARNATEAIVYYEVDGVGYFSRNTVGSTIGKVALQPGYHVTDFHVVADEVCFCGYFGNNEKGIFGSFPAIDIVNNSSSMSYVFLMPIPEVSRINKMVAYINRPSLFNVVAIAESLYVDTTSQYLCSEHKIIYMDLWAMTADPSIPYPYDIYSANRDVFFDIVQTDQYVATIGFNGGISSNHIAMRKCKKTNVRREDLDNLIYYPSTIGEALGYMRACSMGGEKIAVSYMVPGPANDTYRTRTRFIDIESREMFRSNEYDLLTKSDPLELTYIPSLNSVVVLQDIEPDQHYSSFNCLLPSKTATYDCNRLYDTTFHYRSIDWVAENYFVAAGGKRCFIKTGIAPSNTVGCYQHEEKRVFVINNLTAASILSNVGQRTESNYRDQYFLEQEIPNPIISPSCSHYNNP